MKEPAKLEKERRRRIQVALWAYAYEIKNYSMVDDETFDKTCLEIDLSISTGNRRMDSWFKNNFEPHTGVWVHKYPNLERLEQLFNDMVKEAPC